MPATLFTAPPAKVFSKNDTWVTLQTGGTISALAKVRLLFAGAGPTAAQTLRIRWAGNDITFTVTATNGGTGKEIPTKGALTLADYVILVADYFLQNEIVSDYFRVETGADYCDLIQRVHAPVDIVTNSTLTNTTVTPTDVTLTTTPDALRGLVQVWKDTGALATDTRLIALHTPYGSDGKADMNIGPAFSTMRPALPAASSIPAAVLPTAQPYGLATGAFLSYYLRYADKGGVPSVAESLTRSPTYFAIQGKRSADSLHNISNALRHGYNRADRVAFIKPITVTQPDWLYWIAPTGVTQVYLSCTVDWSDGTQSTYNPYPTTGVTVIPGSMYWFACGWRQAKIQNAPIGGGTAPDAYVVGYSASLRRADGSPMIGVHGVTYALQPYADWQGMHLLFENGVGGCETVCLRGKVSAKAVSTAEEYAAPRNKDWTTTTGDLGFYQQRSRKAWECNTGWFSDPYYLDHLRQLALGECWMIDLERRQFLRVIVTPGETTTNVDDDTLFSQSFTVRAAWLDEAANS